MKETLLNTQTGDRMVRRVALTRSGVKVSTFVVNNTSVTSDSNISENATYTDIRCECSDIISEQTDWLDIEINVFNQIALCNPRIEIINPFSEKTKILITANNNIVKVFDIGGLNGYNELDFLENDELVDNPENSEDTAKYFKSSGYKSIDIDGRVSPIIINPYSVSSPSLVTAKIIGNTDPSASGIFKISVRIPEE